MFLRATLAMSDALNLTGHSILIVESEQGVFLATLQESIEKLGAQCVVADSARLAAEILARFTFSAIVINADRRLPRPYDLPMVVYRGHNLSDMGDILKRLAKAVRE
jgi:CheY-like chemotaxis protein